MNPRPVSYLQTDPRWGSLDYSARGEKQGDHRPGHGQGHETLDVDQLYELFHVGSLLSLFFGRLTGRGPAGSGFFRSCRWPPAPGRCSPARPCP